MTRRATTKRRKFWNAAGYWWRRLAILGLGVAVLSMAVPAAHGQSSGDEFTNEYQQHQNAAREAQKMEDFEKMQNEWRECLAIASREIQLKPDWSGPSYRLGLASYYLGQLDEAKQAFQVELTSSLGQLDEAKKAFPEFISVILGVRRSSTDLLWECHMRQGAYSEAVKIAEMGVREFPDDEKYKFSKNLDLARQLEREKRELDKWLATASVPEGRKITYLSPGYQITPYVLERRGGRNRVILSFCAVYKGEAENRDKVRRRLAAAVTWVEGFYRRNGVDLELQCCFEPGIADWLKCARGVDVYDNLATGFYLANTAEWPMLSRNGYSLPESAVFKFAAHEIGHWLGLDHPKDRDASPGDLMVGGSYWHGRLLTPLEVRQILRPLISPTPLDKVCAELGAAIKPCPREHVGQKMHNNWRWFLQDHFAELKRITELEPENSQAWHLLGGLTTNCTDRLNFYTRAIEAATAKEDWSNVGEAKCRRAEVLFNLDQLDRALAELNEILETPKFMLDTCLKAGALTLRAYVHWNRKDFPAAERDMKERTTERPSERLESLWGWGAMKQHLEGRLRLFRADLLLEKGNRAEAIQEVKSVLLNYRPDDTEAFSRLEKLADAATVREFRYKRAYHYACVGRYDEAIADLTPMIEGGSLSAVQLRNMHYLRGVAYRRKKEFDKAIKDYNLISTDADKITLAKLYLELAEVYLEKGEPDKAVSVYGIKPARDYFPKPTSHLYRDRDPEFEQLVLLGRGKVYLALKRADEAIADLTWVIMNWGGNRREREGMGSARHEAALLARAQAWLLKNDTEKAREDLLEAVSLSSDDSSLLELLGKTGMPLHEAYLVRGLGRCGLVTSSGKRLPAFRMDKAKASLALPDLTKAIEISPDYAEAYKWRAVVRRHLGLADGAKADETKAKELAEKTTAVSNEKGAKQ